MVISCQWRTNQVLLPVQHDSAVLFEKPKALIQLFMMDSLFYILRRSEENASRLGDAITVFVFVFSSGWQLSGRSDCSSLFGGYYCGEVISSISVCIADLLLLLQKCLKVVYLFGKVCSWVPSPSNL